MTVRELIALLKKAPPDDIVLADIEQKDSIAERNKYLIQLFMIKKRNLKRGTMEGYLGAIKRLITVINNKSLDQVDETDIEWYLAQYERREGLSSKYYAALVPGWERLQRSP